MIDTNILVIGEHSIVLEYSIRKKIEFTNQVVILMYDKDIIANNVISFDMNGNELWKVNDILKIKRPTGNVDIKKDNENMLRVYSSLGIIFKIDIENKVLIDKSFAR